MKDRTTIHFKDILKAQLKTLLVNRGQKLVPQAEGLGLASTVLVRHFCLPMEDQHRAQLADELFVKDVLVNACLVESLQFQSAVFTITIQHVADVVLLAFFGTQVLLVILANGYHRKSLSSLP